MKLRLIEFSSRVSHFVRFFITSRSFSLQFHVPPSPEVSIPLVSTDRVLVSVLIFASISLFDRNGKKMWKNPRYLYVDEDIAQKEQKGVYIQ